MKTQNGLILPPRENIDPELHPILTRRYTIVTPIMEALIAETVQWINNGVTGAIIEGDPRRGKTKARRLMAQVLPMHFPRLPVFQMIARHYAHPSERVFFGDLLKAFKHSMYSEGTAAQRRDRLMEGVVSVVQSSGQDRLVLFIDQAHRLLEMHYDWLVDFHDELSERGIELFVFLIGQREIATVCDELRRAGKTQIIGRFMADRVRYFGIRSVKDLKACLASYDDKSRFPDDTDWTFTRYYFPEAYAAGWRLAHHAEAFWAAFDEVRRHGAVSGAMEIPMQHFVRAVERFLLDAELSAQGEPVVSSAKLNDYVAATLFAGSLRNQWQVADGDEEEEGEGRDE